MIVIVDDAPGAATLVAVASWAERFPQRAALILRLQPSHAPMGQSPPAIEPGKPGRLQRTRTRMVNVPRAVATGAAGAPGANKMGLAIIEAMMNELPIVTLAATEMTTMIHNDVSGYADTDPGGLKRRMRLLLDDVRSRDVWAFSLWRGHRGCVPNACTDMEDHMNDSDSSTPRHPGKEESAHEPEPPARGKEHPADPGTDMHRENQKELGVGEDHRTEEMQKEKRGTFP